jgi:hypothetical protein
MWYDISNIVHQAAEAFRNFVGVVAGVDDAHVVRALKTNASGELVTQPSGGGTPTVYRIDIAVINTQYSQVLPVATRNFSIQPRQNRSVRFAFVTGKVAGSVEPYATMKNGAPYTSPPLNLAGALTIYVAAGIPNTDVEIIAWS